MGQIDYFSKFPKIKYPYRGKIINDGTQAFVDYIECQDLTVKFKLREEVINSGLQFYPYTWEDGDRPDTIAEIYYGNEKYHWIVLLSSEIYDWIYDLPLTDSEMFEFLEQKYVGTEINTQPINSVDELKSIVHHYEDGDGYVIDFETYSQSGDVGKRAVSYFDYHFDQNEQRRQIKLINRDYLPQIVREFDEKLRKIKKDRKKQKESFSEAGF